MRAISAPFCRFGFPRRKKKKEISNTTNWATCLLFLVKFTGRNACSPRHHPAQKTSLRFLELIKHNSWGLGQSEVTPAPSLGCKGYAEEKPRCHKSVKRQLRGPSTAVSQVSTFWRLVCGGTGFFWEEAKASIRKLCAHLLIFLSEKKKEWLQDMF